MNQVWTWISNLLPFEFEWKRDEAKLAKLTLKRQRLYRDSDGLCFCCGKRLAPDGWHAGHIVARKYGGSTGYHNLKAVCPPCNLAMRCEHMFEFIVRMRYVAGLKNITSHPMFPYALAKSRLRAKAEELLRSKGLPREESFRLAHALEDPATFEEAVQEICSTCL